MICLSSAEVTDAPAYLHRFPAELDIDVITSIVHLKLMSMGQRPIPSTLVQSQKCAKIQVMTHGPPL